MGQHTVSQHIAELKKHALHINWSQYEQYLTSNKLNKIIGLNINLYGLPSIYWGQEQVVTGLLTGEDLIIGLKDKDLGEAIFIPSMMLKINTDLFLDDKNISEVEKALGSEIHVVDDANDIIKNLIGIKTAKRFANHV